MVNSLFDGVNSDLPRNEECKQDGCPICHGTFLDADGEKCVHFIICDCVKCKIEKE